MKNPPIKPTMTITTDKYQESRTISKGDNLFVLKEEALKDITYMKIEVFVYE